MRLKHTIAMALVLLAAACSSTEEPKPAPVVKPVVKSDSDNVTEQEKRYFVAKHAVERNTNKRWEGFRTVMDLAVQGFEPARDYYLSVRETQPVLPGESAASFGTYADAIKIILNAALQKIKKEKGTDCGVSSAFALLDTKKVGGAGAENWQFEYCGEKLMVPVNLSLNRESGRMDAAVGTDGIVIQ